MLNKITDSSSLADATTSAHYTVLDIEIDSQCSTGLVCQTNNTASQLELHSYEDAPTFLKFNPFIKTGYRPMLPASLCIYSLFVWSNETINIWSHLISFLFFFVLMLNELYLHISSSGPASYDNLSIVLGLICYQICTFLSAAYHLLYCHSEMACKRWFALDLAGISVGILGCYIPGVYLAYYCQQVWRDAFMLVVFLLVVIVLALQFHPRFLSASWHSTRIVLYSAIAGYGVIPASYWVYINHGFHAQIVQLFIGKVLCIYVIIMLALFFYVSKIPESIFPGKVDYVGHSHQVWHVLVVAAFLYWYWAGKTLLLYRIEKPYLALSDFITSAEIHMASLVGLPFLKPFLPEGGDLPVVSYGYFFHYITVLLSALTHSVYYVCGYDYPKGTNIRILIADAATLRIL